MLARCPRNLFDLDATCPAVNATHAINEEHRDAPKRNKSKAPFVLMVVATTALTAHRTNRTAVLAGLNPHKQRRTQCRLVEFAALIYEGLVAIQSNRCPEE